LMLHSIHSQAISIISLLSFAGDGPNRAAATRRHPRIQARRFARLRICRAALSSLRRLAFSGRRLIYPSSLQVASPPPRTMRAAASGIKVNRLGCNSSILDSSSNVLAWSRPRNRSRRHSLHNSRTVSAHDLHNLHRSFTPKGHRLCLRDHHPTRWRGSQASSCNPFLLWARIGCAPW